MEKLPDELIIEILNFTFSSLDYINLCKAIKREINTEHMLMLHSRKEIDRKGTIRTYLDNKLHSFNDEPAVISLNGKKIWFYKEKKHRDGDKPAYIHPDGTKVWYQNGLVHREGDNPAKIFPDGTQIWFKHGKVYRDGDKPDIVNENEKIYFKDFNRYVIQPTCILF